MRTFRIVSLMVMAASGLVLGCRGSEKADVDEKFDPVAASRVSGERILHDWRKVHAIETRGTERVRTHVGFIDRRFSEEDPDGKSFVLDRKHDVRGFIIPSGRAFIFEGDAGAVNARDLGNTTFENGVKRILGVSGAIDFERIESASEKPAREPAKAERS